MATNSKGFGKPTATKKHTFSQAIQADRSFYERDISTPEAFRALLEHGYCEDIASVTSSMMGAVISAAQGNLAGCIQCAIAGYHYMSMMTTANERWTWMRNTILKNTGLDIGTPESHNLIPTTDPDMVLRGKPQS